MKKRIACVLILALCLALCGCGSATPAEPAAVPSPSQKTEPTVIPSPTPSPSPSPSPSPTPVPTPTPIPTPTPKPVTTANPTETPVPSNLPRITKSPTDETVKESGRCQFIANYENANWAEWHFVSPDRTRDYDYNQAQNEFKTLQILNGYTKDLTLDSIPITLNGWLVYCRFSNEAGYADTDMARITVLANNPGTASPNETEGSTPTGRTMTAYTDSGNAVVLAEQSDSTWLTTDGVRFYLATDGILRTRDATIILYPYNPTVTEDEPVPPANTPYDEARKYIDRPFEELTVVIGQPLNSEYGPSCLRADAEDGMHQFDGFYVYTLKDSNMETVIDVYKGSFR